VIRVDLNSTEPCKDTPSLKAFNPEFSQAVQRTAILSSWISPCTLWTATHYNFTLKKVFATALSSAFMPPLFLCLTRAILSSRTVLRWLENQMSINRNRPSNFTRETIAIETIFYFCERKAFPIHDIWQVLSPWVFSGSFVGALAAFILQVKGK
jgi:hypothetical protein